MATATDIKYFVFNNFNAPQLTNNFGCMIQVLDACLINGIPLPQVTSLVVDSNLATLTFNTAHLLKPYQVIEVSGANETVFNKQHRILSANSNSLTFQITTSSTQATGILSAKLPSLGWEKPFSSTSSTGGKAAYRSKNSLLTTRPFLRVVDELDPVWTPTYAKYAKVGLVESMSDINTLSGFQTPFDSTAPNNNWIGTGTGSTAQNGWAKWHYAILYGVLNTSGSQSQTQNNSLTPANGARQWFVVGNGDFFYILNNVTPLDGQFLTYGCGVIEKDLSTDEDTWFLASDLSYLVANATYRLYDFNNLAYQLDYASQPTILLYKTLSRLSTDRCFLTCIKTSRSRDALVYSGASNYVLNSGDINGQILTPPIVLGLEGVSTRVLGYMPALYWLLRDKPFSDLQIISNGNHQLLAKSLMSNTMFGQVIFDLGVGV